MSILMRCLLAWLGCASTAFALEPTRIFEMNRGAVGLVTTSTAQGSGVVVEPGIVLTNCHVIAGQRDIYFKAGKSEFKAFVIAGNTALDLCKLGVPGLHSKVATIRNVSDVKVGERVYAIGNPQGFELTLSEGLVSGLRDLEDTVQVQITAPISPGSSGGGLFDANGKLIGITTASLRGGQNINFAMPASVAKRLKRVSFIEQYSESTVLTPEVLDALMDIYERQDIAAGINVTKEWLRRDGESAFAAFVAGVALGYSDKFKESQDAFQIAIGLDPEYAPALGELSFVASRLGDSAKAEEYRRKCAQVEKPKNSLIGSYVALCKAMLGDGSGIRLIDEYIAQNPTRSWLYVYRGAVLLYSKESAKALQSADQAIKLNPQSAAAYAIAVGALVVLQEYQDARARLEIALRISPDSPELLELATIVSAVLKNRGQTIEFLGRLYRVAPSRAQLLRNKYAAQL